MNEWWCWIGPYNAHCFRTDIGQPVRPDGSCHFCGAPDPERAALDPEADR